MPSCQERLKILSRMKRASLGRFLSILGCMRSGQAAEVGLISLREESISAMVMLLEQSWIACGSVWSLWLTRLRVRRLLLGMGVLERLA